MFKNTITLFFITCLCSLLFVQHTFANTFIERTLAWYKATIIEYKTDSKLYDIHIGVHPNEGGTLRSIMSEVNGVSWVNWVFECPKDYSACWWKNYTINERYVQWEKRATYESTGDRVVFAWNDDIEPFLFQTGLINPDDEEKIFEWFANHPLILMNWESQLYRYYEKNLIDNKMKTRATKNFICSNKSWESIYFWLVYNIWIDDMPKALRELGCWNAINLDAWLSTSLIYNNKYVVGPQREILDWVFVSPKNIDINSLNASSKTFISALLESLKNYTTSQKIEKLSSILQTLDEYIVKIYDRNTTEITVSENIYTNIEVFDDLENNTEAQDFIKSADFASDSSYYIENNTIYKKTLSHVETSVVGTKIEFTSENTIKNVALINIIREYLKAIIAVYREVQKLEILERLDDRIEIDVRL